MIPPLAPVILILLGLLDAGPPGRTAYLHWTARRWPRAEGQIEVNFHVGARVGFRYGMRTAGRFLSYRYVVAGVEHVGTSWRLGWPYLFAKAHLRARYPVGAVVPVWYDPQAPDVSVLEPGVSILDLLGATVGLVLMLIGAWWWCVG